ncbi:3-(3-hydroxy-phenyl)propionate hydroxylase [Pseudonocardia endophytica]|uniref:3-(3-hydroxy-phenyl)propionate hydroxylase n=1 Tax=Pseudonocardia endophytica TaxID=401976 RepID=A0A4R1HVV7_PSEEN|nr:3-(3-hydroxy-phenyl)propionate hydroxylase [Pseudonocardia endophytica]
MVVGAGPTGLVAALLLARRGVDVTVLERRAGVHALPRAVHLDDESVRILQAAGVSDGFAAISRPAAGLRLLDARLRPFAAFHRSSRGVHGWAESTLFDQPDLEALLRAHVAADPRITLREGVDVVRIDPPGGSFSSVGTATAEPDVAAIGSPSAGPGGGAAAGGDPSPGDSYRVRLATGEQVPASAVLGCDGARSTVRAAIGARLRALGPSQRWFVVDVRCATPLPTWGGVDQVCDPARAATFLALTGDRYRWEFRMRSGETASELAAQVPSLITRWAPGPVEMLRAEEYTFDAAVADRWSDGRVFLLGDAAHLTPPFIGQGLGAGLRDAHNLAWKLAAVLHDGAPGSWVDGYRSERAPHATTMIRGALRVGRAMTGGSGAVAALRRPLVAGTLRVPAVRRRAEAGLVTRFGPGTLVDRRRDRRDPVGTPCPQPWPGHDGLLGDGWALLTSGAPEQPGPEPRETMPPHAGLPDAGPSDAVQGPVPSELARRAADLGARTVATTDPVLLRWLRTGRVRAVLLRPDRIVAASAPV